ncbi:hypothetical protein A2U01_0075905, partial [Trifolium medium]|nr:hypothetical protein [Trifolium medium]
MFRTAPSIFISLSIFRAAPPFATDVSPAVVLH